MSIPMINYQEFIRRVHSFREKLGNRNINEEQRKGLFRGFTLSYFNLEGTGREIERAAEIYYDNVNEYTLRMALLN